MLFYSVQNVLYILYLIKMKNKQFKEKKKLNIQIIVVANKKKTQKGKHCYVTE